MADDEVGKEESEKEMETTSSWFWGCGNYGKALAETPKRLKERAGATLTPMEEMTQIRERSGGNMRRKLEWYELVGMGVAGMLGAGVFVTTGRVASQTAGPAVVVSYMVAGVSALLSAFCYTEFAVEMPVAGGAFSYLRVTFGEFAGYFAGANLLMEYVLSNAGIARSFTSSLASVFGILHENAWRIKAQGLPHDYNMLDFPAVGLVMLLTLCLCHSTKETSRLNMGVTFLHLVLFSFIIIAGFAYGDIDNLTRPSNSSLPGGFAPYGARGVFEGAAIVYFSYIGYDSVSTLAEEIKHPAKSLPIGVSGSVIIVSVLYCLMSLALCVLMPYDQIGNDSAAFAAAFRKSVGMKWASNMVGAGATLGIIASLVVAMLGQARYLCVIGRASLIPPWFARVNPTTGTPMNATFFLGICTAFIALFTELRIIIDMISIGTLVVFYVVANALIYRRYINKGVTKPWATIVYLVLMSTIATGFALFWNLRKTTCWWALVTFGIISGALTAGFQYWVPVVHHPKDWGVPLMPWLPAASIFLNVFLLSTLNRKSYERFGIWTVVAILFYIFYGVHSTYDTHTHASLGEGEELPPTTTAIQTLQVKEQKIEIQV